jgi:hypothetical protein
MKTVIIFIFGVVLASANISVRGVVLNTKASDNVIADNMAVFTTHDDIIYKVITTSDIGQYDNSKNYLIDLYGYPQEIYYASYTGHVFYYDNTLIIMRIENDRVYISYEVQSF